MYDQDEVHKVAMCIYNGTDSGPISTVRMEVCIGITTTQVNGSGQVTTYTGLYTSSTLGVHIQGDRFMHRT